MAENWNLYFQNLREKLVNIRWNHTYRWKIHETRYKRYPKYVQFPNCYIRIFLINGHIFRKSLNFCRKLMNHTWSRWNFMTFLILLVLVVRHQYTLRKWLFSKNMAKSKSTFRHKAGNGLISNDNGSGIATIQTNVKEYARNVAWISARSRNGGTAQVCCRKFLSVPYTIVFLFFSANWRFFIICVTCFHFYIHSFLYTYSSFNLLFRSKAVWILDSIDYYDTFLLIIKDVDGKYPLKFVKWYNNFTYCTWY